jgi:hypothetical protein
MELTLQINLSGGDVSYAGVTVPRLVAAHRPNVREVVGVVDCCRPQRTTIVEPETKFPLAEFGQRVKRICGVAEGLKSDGVFDRIVYIHEGDARIPELLRKYLGRLIGDTHDCWGNGVVSYLYGFDECKTKYVLHYDADMLLYQGEHYDWSIEGVDYLRKNVGAIAASPRVSPPWVDNDVPTDMPSLHKSDALVEARDGYWRVEWFSTRCFLLDLSRLSCLLPLLTVRNVRQFCEVLVRRVVGRSYPPLLEVLIHRQAQRHGMYRIDLMTTNAFILHPNHKGTRFVRLLPGLIESIGAGAVPREQRGWENITLDAWEDYFGMSSTSST